VKANPSLPRLATQLKNTSPWDKQDEAFAACADADIFALFMEQRTGKSVVTLGKVVHMYRQRKIDGCLIVAMPSGVPANWAAEIDGDEAENRPARVPDDVPRMVVVWDAGRVKTKAFQARLAALLRFDGLAFLLVNGEAILTEAFRTYGAKFVSRRSVLAIADETSLIMKSPGTKRYGVMEKIKARTKYRMILDGTPVGEGPLDLFSQVGWLSHSILGHTSFYSFRNYYAAWEPRTIEVFDKKLKRKVPRQFQVQKEDEQGEKVYLHVDELKERLARVSFRCTRKECFDIPEKLYTPYHYSLSTEQRRVYDSLAEEYEAELADGHRVTAQMVLVRYMRLQQVIGNFWPSEKALAPCPACAGRECECEACDSLGVIVTKTKPRIIDSRTNPRLDALAEVVEANRGDQLIMWARFKDDIDSIMCLLEAKGRKPVRYDGTVSPEDKQKAKSAFQTGFASDFVANQAAAQRGLDLSAAQAMVYYSNYFSGLIRQQSEDRTEVAGRTRGTGVIDIVADGTVDDDIMAAHAQKKSLADYVMRRRAEA
jgi:SNF2 family DNA or RNA helicase